MYRVLLLVSLLATPIFTEADEKTVEFQQLRDNIYMVVCDWPSRITLSVGKDGILIVDANLKDNMPLVYQAINEKFNNMPIKYVISTHSHGDHTGGMPFLIGQGAISIAHENTRQAMYEEYYIDTDGQQESDASQGKPTHDFESKELPRLTYETQMNLYFNDETIVVFHMPDAHTRGDSLVFFKKNNVLALGDNYFGNAYTFGENIEGMIAVYEKTLGMINDETIIVPGHGIASNKRELSRYFAMIKTVKSIIQRNIKQGKTLSQVVADTSITAKFDSYYGTLHMNGEEFRKMMYEQYSDNSGQ